MVGRVLWPVASLIASVIAGVHEKRDTVPNGWQPVNMGQWSAYSRQLRVINTPANSPDGGGKKLLFANGGNMGCSGSCYNYVATGVQNIPNYP